jgi:hypothetical protein
MLSVSDLAAPVASVEDETTYLLSAPAIRFAADAAAEHQEGAGLDVLALVRNILATAYETYEGEPTLLMLLRTHTAITTQMHDKGSQQHAINLDERAYDMLVELSFSPEPGGWWSKLETYHPPVDAFDGNDGTNANTIHQSAFASERPTQHHTYLCEGKTSGMLLESVHNWLMLSFPRRHCPLPIQLAESQTGRNLALWCATYPALGRVAMRPNHNGREGIAHYFETHANATRARSHRVLKQTFHGWLREAATTQASRYRAVCFRIRVLLHRWRKKCSARIADESMNWRIVYSAFVQWNYQTRYDQQIRVSFKAWRKRARSTRMRNIVFESRASRAFWYGKQRAFAKLRGYTLSMNGLADRNIQRKFFSQWKQSYLTARSKAEYANLWIRVSHRVILRRVFTAWTRSILQRQHLVSAMVAIANSVYTRDTRRAFYRMANKLDPWQTWFDTDDQGFTEVSVEEKTSAGLIALLMTRHNRALKEVLKNE